MTIPGTIRASLADVRPDIVVNAAAYTAVDKAESEEQLAHKVNAAGAGELAALCDKLGVPLVHISTDYVFDGAKRSAYVETDPTGPRNAYGRSKLAGEQAVIAATSRHVILRTSWVYSPFGTNFVRTMLRLAADLPELRVVDDQIGCPTYAPHLAVAILAVAARLQSDITGGRCHEWSRDIAASTSFPGPRSRRKRGRCRRHARRRAPTISPFSVIACISRSRATPRGLAAM